MRLTVAHAKFAEHWHAERILRDVEKLNPEFYPRPLVQLPLDGNSVEFTGDYLRKQEFIEVYDKCSQILHAQNPYAPAPDTDWYEQQLPIWKDKIAKLLSIHAVLLPPSDKLFVVVMKLESDGKSAGFILDRIESPHT